MKIGIQGLSEVWVKFIANPSCKFLHPLVRVRTDTYSQFNDIVHYCARLQVGSPYARMPPKTRELLKRLGRVSAASLTSD
jgi:hypothetical protein